MIINGAKIYSEGVGLGHECETKIRQIMATLNAHSKSSNLSMRLLKAGRNYEALVWGKTDDIPIGVYNRGSSLRHVLDIVHDKVKSQCAKCLSRSARATRPQPQATHLAVAS